MAGNIITGAFLTLCSYSDIKRREIYVKPALALILLGIVFAALQGRDSLLSAFLGALTGVALIILSGLCGKLKHPSYGAFPVRGGFGNGPHDQEMQKGLRASLCTLYAGGLSHTDLEVLT